MLPIFSGLGSSSGILPTWSRDVYSNFDSLKGDSLYTLQGQESILSLNIAVASLTAIRYHITRLTVKKTCI